MLENSEKLNNQAVCFAMQGEYDEAIACLKRAITVENNNSLLWFNLGLTYRDSGRIEQARETIKYAYSLNPTNEEIIETLAVVCLSLGAYDDAMLYCTEGLELNGFNPHFWNVGGVVHFNKNDFCEAAEFFERAVSLDSHYYDALFNLRDTYTELGNKAGAEECERLMASIKGKNAK